MTTSSLPARAGRDGFTDPRPAAGDQRLAGRDEGLRRRPGQRRQRSGRRAVGTQRQAHRRNAGHLRYRSRLRIWGYGLPRDGRPTAVSDSEFGEFVDQYAWRRLNRSSATSGRADGTGTDNWFERRPRVDGSPAARRRRPRRHPSCPQPPASRRRTPGTTGSRAHRGRGPVHHRGHPSGRRAGERARLV